MSDPMKLIRKMCSGGNLSHVEQHQVASAFIGVAMKLDAEKAECDVYRTKIEQLELENKRLRDVLVIGRQNTRGLAKITDAAMFHKDLVMMDKALEEDR